MEVLSLRTTGLADNSIEHDIVKAVRGLHDVVYIGHYADDWR